MKAKQVSLILLIAMGLSLLTIGQAQAKELAKVTIRGPGLNGEVELTDRENLNVIDELGFADQTYHPTSVGAEPYFEIRAAVGDGQQIVATNIYYYYPASKEHPGYIYYAGGINAWSSRDGQSFLLPEDTDRKLQELLANLGASLPDKTNPTTATLAFPSSLFCLIVGSSLCIMIGIGIKLKHPATNTNR
jgi:hypothetical protein